MFRIYLIYIIFAVFGWLCGQIASQWLPSLNELHLLRFIASIGIGSLALQQAITIKHRLGDIEGIEGLTKTERSRLRGLLSILKSEAIFGTAIVIIGNIVITITAFSNLNSSVPTYLILSSFFSVILFSIVLFFRMHWFLGNQIDRFKAQIRQRLEDQEKKKSMLKKLQV